MKKGYVLYNPLAGSGSAREDAELLQVVFDEDLEYFDMTQITNYPVFLSGMERDDFLVIVGGDGTLNRFANDTSGLEILQKILYLSAGSGNDFEKDVSANGNPVQINQYLKALPSVEVKGRKYHFINAVGFGVDGYCCQVRDALKKISGRKINYTAITAKGILSRFDARNAKVTVDGKEYVYNKVWIAPTMHGRYYGGGMLPAPEQVRNCGKLSVMLFHGAGRLRALCAFPGIFKGRHIKHTNMVAIHTGEQITVEFDRPTPLQIDGETVLDVSRYTAKVTEYKENQSKEKV